MTAPPDGPPETPEWSSGVTRWMTNAANLPVGELTLDVGAGSYEVWVQAHAQRLVAPYEASWSTWTYWNGTTGTGQLGDVPLSRSSSVVVPGL